MTPGHILGPEQKLLGSGGLGPLVRTLTSLGVWREYGEFGPVWSPGWAGQVVGRTPAELHSGETLLGLCSLLRHDFTQGWARVP